MWTFFSWKSQNIFYAKLSQNSSEVIACDCLLKGIEPLCVINFCRFVIIDLIQDARHICTRFRMDGEKSQDTAISDVFAVFAVFAFMDKSYISLDQAPYLLQITSLYFLNTFYTVI